MGDDRGRGAIQTHAKKGEDHIQNVPERQSTNSQYSS